MNRSIARRSFVKTSLALGGAAVAGMPPIDSLPRAQLRPGLVVETSSGRLEGEAQGDVLVFRGIPFAKPPVGPLRFRPPEPPEPWTGIRDATTFGPGAPQGVNPFEMLLPVLVPETSEDCLYLNVFTPGTTRQAAGAGLDPRWRERRRRRLPAALRRERARPPRRCRHRHAQLPAGHLRLPARHVRRRRGVPHLRQRGAARPGGGAAAGCSRRSPPSAVIRTTSPSSGNRPAA